MGGRGGGTDQPRRRLDPRATRAERLGVAGLVSCVAVVALATVVVDLRHPPAAEIDAVAMAFPSHRLVEYLTEGEDGPTYSSTVNVVLTPDEAAVSLPATLASAVTEELARTGPPDDARVVFSTVRELYPDGLVFGRELAYVASPERGAALVGWVDDNGAVIFEPAMHELPADLTEGAEWEAEGMSDLGPYRRPATITGSGPRTLPVGTFEHCIDVEATFDLAGTTQEQQSTWCRGAGVVASDVDDGTRVGRALSVPGHSTFEELPPPDVLPIDRPVDPSGWEAAAYAALAGRPLTPPVPLGLDGTVVITRELPAAIVGFGPDGVVWSLPTDAPCMSSSADQIGGVLVGCTDGTIWSIDGRGLVRWTVDVGDAVSTAPIAVGDVVIAASEDGGVSALDAAGGEERWRETLGTPLATAAALSDELVAVGGDDGTVAALAIDDGAVRWTTTLDAAPADPMAVDGARLVVAAGSSVVRLDAGDGAVVSTGDVGGTISDGPAVADGAAVVATGGDLVAVDDTGSIVWRVDVDASGGPVAAGSAVLVATARGGVELVDAASGGSVMSWDARDVVPATDADPSFHLGGSVGHGAAYLATAAGSVLRIGPAAADDPEQLDLAWYADTTAPPYGGAPVISTPFIDGGEMYVVDSELRLIRVDPAGGAGTVVADLVDGGTSESIGAHDVTTAPGTAFVVTDRELLAVELPSGDVRWREPLDGEPSGPPAVGDHAVVLGMVDDDGGALEARSIADGSLLWRRGKLALIAAGLGPTPTVAGDIVVSGPGGEGYDVRTGDQRWRGTPFVVTGGGGVGDGVVVLPTSIGPGEGGLVGIDVASGEWRWSTELRPGERVGVHDRPLVVGDQAVVATTAGTLVGVSVEAGAITWHRQLDAPFFGRPGVIDGRIWVVHTDGSASVVDPTDGRLVGRFLGIGIDISRSSVVQRPAGISGVAVIAAGPAVLGVLTEPR